MINETKVPCGGFAIDSTLKFSKGVLGANVKALRIIREIDEGARGDAPAEKYYIADDSDYKSIKEATDDLTVTREYEMKLYLYNLTNSKTRSLAVIYDSFSGSSASEESIRISFSSIRPLGVDARRQTGAVVIEELALTENKQSREISANRSSVTFTLSSDSIS